MFAQLPKYLLKQQRHRGRGILRIFGHAIGDRWYLESFTVNRLLYHFNSPPPSSRTSLDPPLLMGREVDIQLRSLKGRMTGRTRTMEVQRWRIEVGEALLVLPLPPLLFLPSLDQ